MDFEDFFQGYLVCLLWSSTGDDDEPLDEYFDITDIHPDALAQMRAECHDFFYANLADLQEYEKSFPSDYAGHDFCLTRNGHGAGFWDRGLGDVGKRLTISSKIWGDTYIYIGDDGMLHV